MAYTTSLPLQGPYQNDESQRLLFKIARYLAAVITGEVGFLVRGSVTSAAKQFSTAPSNSAPITSAADITLVAGDVLTVQNLGTNALFVRRGTGATSSLFNYTLQAAGVADDGTGGAIVIDDFVGVVSFAGTTVRYNAWKA